MQCTGLRCAVTLLAVLLSLPGSGAGQEKAPAEAVPRSCSVDDIGCSGDPAASWVDNTYGFVTESGDSLAQWFDSYFGPPDADLQSADSVLRLLGEYEWDQEQGNDLKLRLRGKVDLPRLDRRLSVVFSEDDYERRDVVPDAERQDSDVGLVYRVAERANSRVYLSVGTNASLEFRSSLRYRFDYAIDEHWSTRFSERLYYKEDDGFGTLSRADLDYAIDSNRVLRWTTDVDYGEETDGAEWGTRLGYFRRLNDKEAVNGFAAAAGQTDPESWVGTYSLGIRYRRSVFRPWIFVELEPAHLWRKDNLWENRSSAWTVTTRIEFREELGNRRAERRPAVQPGAP